MPEIEEELFNHDDYFYIEHGDVEDFMIGMKVCYVSNNYGDRDSNPLWGGAQGFIVGEVREVDWDTVYVNWETGATNSYDPDDLRELVEK